MAALLLLAVAPFALGLGIIAEQGYSVIWTSVGTRAEAVDQRIDVALEDRVSAAFSTLGLFSASGGAGDDIAQKARSLISLDPSRLSGLALRAPDGHIIQQFPAVPNQCSMGFAQAAGFSAPLSGQHMVRPRYPGAAGRGACLELTVPLQKGLNGVGFISALVPVTATRASIEAESSDPGDLPVPWVIDDQGHFFPVCVGCSAHDAPAPRAPEHISSFSTIPDPASADMTSHAARPLVFAHHGYALSILPGGMKLMLIATRTPRERQAQHSFVVTVCLAVVILIVMLSVVIALADAMLVRPIEQLMDALGEWRQGGVFDTRITRSMPVELRALGFSFKRATRRLARHEARLDRSMERQRLLMHEIHHRVKNNLQIVASLLNLQANRIRQPEAQQEFRQARDRVRTLATLHRHLYPETGSTAMRMPDFLKELCTQIAAAHGEQARGRIKIDVEADDFEMAADQAVPLALITTEIVSNALRYAFPDDRSGRVHVSLRQTGKAQAEMRIEDDGIGLAVGERAPDRSHRSGLGLQLIRGFVRQIGGTLNCISTSGTAYTVNFPLQPVDHGEPALFAVSGRGKVPQG